MLTTKEDRVTFSTVALFISSFLSFIVAFVLTMAGVGVDAFKAGPLELVFVFSVFIALASYWYILGNLVAQACFGKLQSLSLSEKLSALAILVMMPAAYGTIEVIWGIISRAVRAAA